MNNFISYNGLPIKSGGGHSLGKITPKEAFDRTRGFIQEFGDNSYPIKMSLEQYKSEDREFNSSKIHWDLRKKFGFLPRREVWRFPDGKQRLWHWDISARQLDKAIEYLDVLETLPKHEFGPINLRMAWNFKLIDLETKRLLPNQHLIPTIDFRRPNNMAHLTLSHKSTLSTWIAFPFTSPDQSEFTEYLARMKQLAPFKFSKKHWRLWNKSEKGNWSPKRIEI